jgi:hypothetical protein
VGIWAVGATDLGNLHRHELLKILKAQGKTADAIVQNMLCSHHSGFNVCCGQAIWPHNDKGLEKLARCIIRASFSQERMTDIAADESFEGDARHFGEGKPETMILKTKMI